MPYFISASINLGPKVPPALFLARNTSKKSRNYAPIRSILATFQTFLGGSLFLFRTSGSKTRQQEGHREQACKLLHSLYAFQNERERVSKTSDQFRGLPYNKV